MTRLFGPDRQRVTALRIAAQRLTTREFGEPVDVVRHLFAMQAQDFPGVKWSIGLRMIRSTDAGIEHALASRAIVRSWPMRGTLHVMAADDLGWLLSLTAERMIRSAAGRHRQLGLGEDDFAAARRVTENALSGGATLARSELLRRFDEAGLSTEGQRGAHLLVWLAQSRVTVFGAVDGKTQTFALYDDWIRHPRDLDRDEALAELAMRYLIGHGPATDRDLAWWSSLTLGDVRRGIEAAGDAIERTEIGGITYLHEPGLEPAGPAVLALPGFDEYLLGYQDRSAALHADHSTRIVPGGNGMFLPTIVVDGEVVGTWKRTVSATEARIDASPFASMSARHRAAFERSIGHYGEFVGRPVRVLEPAAPRAATQRAR